MISSVLRAHTTATAPTSARTGGTGIALFSTVRRSIIAAQLVLLTILLTACGGGYSGPSPIDILRSKFAQTPTFSLVLADAKEEEGRYWQKYYVVTEGAEKPQETEWLEASEETFNAVLPFLGMTVFQKRDWQETFEAAPPGYEYVGNSRYGEWKTDSNGMSFWAFYGQYRLMSDVLGWGRVHRDDYYAYRTNRQNGRPYYGPNKEWGLNGSKTKQKRDSFFKRAQSRDLTKRSSFANKVNNRVGRSRTTVRSRSFRAGK